MSLGLIVKTGRILTARLLMGDPIEGITHCAIGDGDATFTDPVNPPAPDIDQTALKNERARKKQYKRTFLKEDPEGCQSALKIDPPSASNIDPPKRVMFA